MVKLAVQLIDRQTGEYDAADMEDRYETRLRALIDAKMKGKGLEPEEDAPPDRGNVVDLMAAMKKSLGNKAPEAAKPPAAAKLAKAKPAPAKLPMKATASRPAKPSRRRA